MSILCHISRLAVHAFYPSSPSHRHHEYHTILISHHIHITQHYVIVTVSDVTLTFSRPRSPPCHVISPSATSRNAPSLHLSPTSSPHQPPPEMPGPITPAPRRLAAHPVPRRPPHPPSPTPSPRHRPGPTQRHPPPPPISPCNRNTANTKHQNKQCVKRAIKGPAGTCMFTPPILLCNENE